MNTPDVETISACLDRLFPEGTCDDNGRSLRSPRFEVVRVYPYPDGGFFRRWALFHVSVSGITLETAVLPSSDTIGLFAWNSDVCVYPNEPEGRHLQFVLAREGPRLSRRARR